MSRQITYDLMKDSEKSLIHISVPKEVKKYLKIRALVTDTTMTSNVLKLIEADWRKHNDVKEDTIV